MSRRVRFAFYIASLISLEGRAEFGVKLRITSYELRISGPAVGNNNKLSERSEVRL